jgi:hypothetical protein
MDRDPQETLQEVAAEMGWDTASMLLVCLSFIAAQGPITRHAFAAHLDTIRAEEQAWAELATHHQGA